MTATALWHRIYTNAAADARWETTGGRVVEVERDAARVLPPEAVHDLDDLLKKAAPAGDAIGFVIRRYKGGADDFVCVIASYGRLIADTGGRGGRLNHARVVKVRDLLFDVAALINAAEDLPIDAIEARPMEERLSAYLDAAAKQQTIDIQRVTLDELRETSRADLVDILAACLSVHGKKQAARFLLPPPENQTLANTVAQAWAAMPLGLQRSASWAVNVDDGCPVDAILSTEQGHAPAISPQITETVSRYVNGLLDGPRELGAILRSADVASLGRLKDAVQQVRTMDKKSKGTPAATEMGPAELDRQYKAIEQSLKAYVDQRLDALDPQRESAYESRPRVVPSSRPVDWKPWLIGGVIAAVLIAAGSWYYFAGRRPARTIADDDSVQQQADLATTTTEPRPMFGGPSTEEVSRETIKSAIASASADGKWGQSFKDLLEKHGPIVSAALHDAADGRHLDGNAVTPAARDVMLELATKIDAKQALSKDDRDNTRELLLDYVSALAGGEVSVDGNLRDVTTERLKKQYKVVTRTDERKDVDLQSEIILRWLETTLR
jgi:hypothetical protein